jgi:pimeloyl-ACP methyl ester carboxylesterase
VLIVLGALGLLPPVQARGKSLGVLAEALGLPFPRPFAAPCTRSEVVLGGVEGDRYDPGRGAAGMLLLPGAAPLGKDDPRAIRLAEALCRAGRVVFVPQLELRRQTFVEEDLDRIVRSTVALAGETARPVTLVGISYGGSFGLVAAADPRIEGALGRVGVFGAYFDLVGVIQSVTTGISEVDGFPFPWEAHPLAETLMREHALTLVPETERPALRAALAEEGDLDVLPAGSRAMYDLLTNRDPARAFDLAESLPPEARSTLTRFSPSTVADRIDVPVMAMHSTDDRTVAYGESIRLVRGLPGTPLVTLRGFTHVDLRHPGTWVRATADLWGAWGFATWLLGPGE